MDSNGELITTSVRALEIIFNPDFSHPEQWNIPYSDWKCCADDSSWKLIIVDHKILQIIALTHIEIAKHSAMLMLSVIVWKICISIVVVIVSQFCKLLENSKIQPIASILPHFLACQTKKIQFMAWTLTKLQCKRAVKWTFSCGLCGLAADCEHVPNNKIHSFDWDSVHSVWCSIVCNDRRSPCSWELYHH